jgi:GLPGLI family protein
MISKSTFIFLLLLVNTLMAQIQNGSLEYHVTVGTDEWFEKLNKGMKELYIRDMESQVFLLEFNQEASTFIYEGGISFDGRQKSPVIYFREKDTLYSLRPKNDPDFGKIIVIEDRNISWKLTNETKLVDGYLCLMAESHIIRNYGETTFNFPLIAWYCPEIPVPFGPLGYGGLPGLILELQERNVLYGVQKMNFNIKEMKDIEKPNEGKRITVEELNGKISELYKNE